MVSQRTGNEKVSDLRSLVFFGIVYFGIRFLLDVKLFLVSL